MAKKRKRSIYHFSGGINVLAVDAEEAFKKADVKFRKMFPGSVRFQPGRKAK